MAAGLSLRVIAAGLGSAVDGLAGGRWQRWPVGIPSADRGCGGVDAGLPAEGDEVVPTAGVALHGARQQRKHQWPAAPVPTPNHQHAGPHPRPVRRDRRRAQRPTSTNTGLPDTIRSTRRGVAMTASAQTDARTYRVTRRRSCGLRVGFRPGRAWLRRWSGSSVARRARSARRATPAAPPCTPVRSDRGQLQRCVRRGLRSSWRAVRRTRALPPTGIGRWWTNAQKQSLMISPYQISGGVYGQSDAVAASA